MLYQLVEASVAAAESDDRDTAADEGDGKRGKRGGGHGQLGDLGKFMLHGDSAGHDAEIARARARAAAAAAALGARQDELHAALELMLARAREVGADTHLTSNEKVALVQVRSTEVLEEEFKPPSSNPKQYTLDQFETCTFEGNLKQYALLRGLCIHLGGRSCVSRLVGGFASLSVNE